MMLLTTNVLVALLILLQSAMEIMSFGILKAFLSPRMPRINRIKHLTPREITDPLAVFDFVALVKQHDYPAEEHNVTTVDGYKLILHRIPSSPKSPPMKRKPAVLIQHGLLASSDHWVLMGPGKDLAFLLADAGYDVWIGNFRGNTYSRSHLLLNPDSPAFWQFSFHEMGYYDLPAMVDYILDETAQKSLTYIGHSMGSTASYILLSTRPEYNKRLRLVISLAPVAYWKHKSVGFQKLAVDNEALIETALRKEGIFELAPQSSTYTQLITALCNDDAITQAACVTAIFSVSGFSPSQLNVSLIPYLSIYFPAGMSLKTIIHYYQNIVTGKFRPYDYGYVGNFAHYEKEEPPNYDVSKITAPVALFVGQSDVLSKEEDAKELIKRLPNIVKYLPIYNDTFNHIDFVWANDAKRLLYDDLMDLIRRFK